TNRTHETRRIPAHVHEEFGLSRLARGRIVEHDVHLAARFISDLAALKIPHDADDGVRDTVDRHRAAEWIAGTEIPLRHRLVDHRGGRHGLEIARLDVAAANQARADGTEKVRADAIESNLALRIRLRNETRHIDVAAGRAPTEQSVIRERDRIHTR